MASLRFQRAGDIPDLRARLQGREVASFQRRRFSALVVADRARTLFRDHLTMIGSWLRPIQPRAIRLWPTSRDCGPIRDSEAVLTVRGLRSCARRKTHRRTLADGWRGSAAVAEPRDIPHELLRRAAAQGPRGQVTRWTSVLLSRIIVAVRACTE